MNKFLSRKFLMTVGTWLYALGGLVTGALDAKTALTAVGASGVVYIIAEAVVDALRAMAAKPATTTPPVPAP